MIESGILYSILLKKGVYLIGKQVEVMFIFFKFLAVMNIKLESAFRDLFSTPEKWMTILLLAVCMLIPVVGPMVISGYLIRRFASVRRGIPAVDFKFDYFGEYLQIGLWPFLCSMVVSVVAMPLFLLCYTPMVLMMADPKSGALVAVSIVLMLALFAIVSILLTLIMYPAILRSGLQMNFGAGFSGGFIRDFLKRVGWQVILWTVILIAISIPLYIVGYLALFQMYDLYLERGGEEIEVADDIYGSVPVTPPSLPPSLPAGKINS